ncbi:hypothetical protein [Trinickia mobilis]|uniref:hypothetical protein n=1 Tax=Trinickia mobilis TaxID=2816356 RepID=UPI001A8F8B31|nr:hypothetical protein [Trinickia mobilis]
MTKRDIAQAAYVGLHREIADVVESTRAAAARGVKALMTATYREIWVWGSARPDRLKSGFADVTDDWKSKRASDSNEFER